MDSSKFGAEDVPYLVGGVGMTARLVAGAAYLGPLVYFVWFILRGRVALFWWSRFEAVDAFAPFEIAPAQLYREPKPGPILLGVVFHRGGRNKRRDS